MDFRDALGRLVAEITPQPWEHTVDDVTLTVIPAGLREDKGRAEVYLRITQGKTRSVETAITTTDLPALIEKLEAGPITGSWEHQPHWPDGTEMPRVGWWLESLSGLAMGPDKYGSGGFTVVVLRDASGDGDVEWAAITLPDSERMPLASAIRRALDVARGWED
ncbi:predicted protein [Streptomyces viridosporus ATCC 14672]|uniref:Predicted protein n=1 Tax=Streptomyces viridosporus (strain ATCC 14672 / DSM 40746 / JCM 4963 / KCTC 9882 / NRRL B-12104 / FH 1290) TaxID=566461 RepID=D6A4E6_STRV1|nr:hypothetical protein [Streptomyces viridosporus]EFE65786.1 predicted protein [Streptomyces viridosporus ATCC 14672]